MSATDLDRHLQAEKELSETLKNYAGKWVAVSNHEVVASADTAEELLEQTKAERVERRFRVSEAGPALL